MAKLHPKDENKPIMQGTSTGAGCTEGTTKAEAQRQEGAWLSPRSRKEATMHKHDERGWAGQEARSRTFWALWHGDELEFSSEIKERSLFGI